MNRIKKLRLERGETLEKIAKYLNVTIQTVSNYENEKRDMTPETILKLSDYFKVTTDYLLGSSDIPLNKSQITQDVQEVKEDKSNAFPLPDTPIKLPILGKIAAGMPILAVENIEGYEFAPSSHIKKGYEYFYLKVSGDSMNLKFNENDIVLIQKQDFLANGEIGVILVNGYDATIKKFQQKNGFVFLEPMSSNPIHQVQIYDPKETEIKIIGKAVSYQGKVN